MKVAVGLLMCVVGVLALVGVGTGVAILVDGFVTRPRPADLAVVFGSKVETSGRPSHRLAARLDAAQDLYRRGLVHTIFVSGGTGVEGFDESQVMRDYLLARGIPESDVHADPDGRTTALTCENARAYLAERREETVNVVSQYFHLTRAKIACARAGVRVVGGAAPRFFEGRDLYSLAREVPGIYAYLLGGRGPARSRSTYP